MSTPSNLYAEKVFGEHPLALWPLDDKVDYLSFISEEQRDFSDSDYWQLTDCSVVENFTVPSKISGTGVYEVSGTNSIELYASKLVDVQLNKDLESVNIGFWFYPKTENINSIAMGYKYDSLGSPTYVEDEEYLTTFTGIEIGSWQYISQTFPLPPDEKKTISASQESLIFDLGEPTTISIPSHGFSDGDKVKLSFDYDIPSGLDDYATYYVFDAEEDTFKLQEEIGEPGLEFGYPEFGNMYIVLIKSLGPFVRVNSQGSGSSEFYLNGFSVGQLSEEFSETSLGVLGQEIPDINISPQYSGIKSQIYGLQDLPSYYLVRENKLLAKNYAMPIAFGSSNLTSILPDRQKGPSMIVPGNGFLNESGRYRSFTLEMWMRIDPFTKEAKRILGPIASEDGLYVDGPFLIIKINDNVGSHYISEWYRPMLINFLVFRNGASLTINGEKVIDLSFDSAALELPEKLGLNERDQDWLGFYSYNDIGKFEIDCVSIYSYRVPSVLAKRRWVYGQAIDFPENLINSYSGDSFVADYTFANYGNNYIYPDIARWTQGISENLSLNNKVLQPPEYSLPEVIFNNKNFNLWQSSLSESDSNGITLKPSEAWVDTDGYMLFNSANILNQKTQGFYGVFEPRLGFDSTETLFRLENKISGGYLSIDLHTEKKQIQGISGTTINSLQHGLKNNDIVQIKVIYTGTEGEQEVVSEYYVNALSKDSFQVKISKDGNPEDISSVIAQPNEFVAHFIQYRLSLTPGQEVLMYQTPSITLGNLIVAGIDFNKFRNFFGGRLSSFLSNKSQLKLFVGGNKEFSKTFSGYIYRLGFATEKNLSSLKYLFDNTGVPFLRYQFDGNGVIYLTGKPGEEDDGYYPEETVDSGYVYEDYLNDIIAHKASYTLVLRSAFGEKFLDIATSSFWQDDVSLSYLAKNYIDSRGKTRYGIDFVQFNSDVSAPNNFLEENYDFSYLPVKTYISFQLTELGPTKLQSDFLNVQEMPRSRIIHPGANWMSTLYEVVDGAIIYPPPGVNILSLSMVVHVDISSEGLIKNPVRVRAIKLVGKTLDEVQANVIGTKTGLQLIPYKRYGFYFDYKSTNPYTIYTDSTPHLYLSKKSGIELTGSFGSEDRGISIPVNTKRVKEYDLSAIHFSMRFSREDLVSSPVQIIEISNNNEFESFKLWIEPVLSSKKRFRLYLTDANNERIVDARIYLNGKRLSQPIVSIGDWNSVGLELVRPLRMDGESGRINFVGPVLFNNVSYYALSRMQKAKLKNALPKEYVGINLSEVYEDLVGTDKIIVGDSLAISPQDYQYSFIGGISVQSETIRPV